MLHVRVLPARFGPAIVITSCSHGVPGLSVSACVDASTADGAAIPEELRTARDLTAYLADVPIRTSDALVPAADVVPAAAISALVTEHGCTTPGTPGTPGTPA